MPRWRAWPDTLARDSAMSWRGPSQVRHALPIRDTTATTFNPVMKREGLSDVP
jgi:hypothetical protein